MSYFHWPPLLESLLEAVWLVDPQTQRIVCANRAATVLQQVPLQDLCGSLATDWTVGPEDALFWDTLAPEGCHNLESETVLRRRDGGTVQVLRRITPVSSEDGAPLYLVAMQDQSEQHATQQRLEHMLGELRATLDSTADGILVCDLDGRIRAFNRRFARLWELPDALLTQQSDEAIQRWLNSRIADAEGYRRQLGLIQRSPLLEADDVLVLQSGRLLERITRPQLAQGRPIGRVYAFRDITERCAAESQLKLAAKVFESSLDAIFITDPQRRILVCNPAAQLLTQTREHELAGAPVGTLFFSPGPNDWQAGLELQLEGQGYWQGELWHRRADQSELALHLSWVVLRDAAGLALNTVLFAKDLSEKLAAQQRIEQLAYTDALTGLPNRLTLTDRVSHAIRVAQRSGAGFAVLFLDLDRFKHINDSLGHLFGDKVLIEIAHRLQHCLRQTDTLCRLGGDEFVIHLHESESGGAEISARRLIDAVVRPIEIDELNFNLSCSIGIALYPHDGETLDELIRHADTAMYEVKGRGKGHYRFYRPEMNADLLARIQLDHALREGLRTQQFLLHYQPRIDLRSGQLRSCEALLRWQHPERGLVLPGGFIGVAEETGFIVALGDWVLDSAVQQAVAWLRMGTPCPVAINVSALQFHQADWVARVARALNAHALPAELLELELTESILIRDADEALERLLALRDLGVRLSLDDFGTGYSSLTYLKRFPLQQLKIDRCFIAAMHTDPVDAAIVAAIIQMGQALQMEVVAEGVELPEQHARLQALGCDQFQGFLYSPAVPALQFERFLPQPR
ncbi:sensor domain-containing protein [Serpentinimonas maccroryi]|uniref:sensor domain-containing protein n=1 Tax=Serpentinimonas maccroryi TaxID=1458426 RepID=UPI00203336DF|nr:EAL domain-containing protein [Serpentinimonas maccroryi]